MATPQRSSSRFIPGEGPEPCDLMVIGEGPGKDEDRYGRPFVGKSGKELNRYLWHNCRRTRTSVYVTNLVKYHIEGDNDPTDADIKRDAPFLEREISEVNPQIIASVGRWSTRYLLGDVDMDCVHGIAHQRHNRIIVPCIHPAAGLHNTEFQAKIAWDFTQLGGVLEGDMGGMVSVHWEAYDDYDAPNYYEGDLTLSKPSPMAVDTEGSVKQPWCLTYADQPGRAVMWRGRTAQLIIKRPVILHNALHDIPVLRAMGFELSHFDDTMIMAYLLGIEPQGLKALAKRHCGMVMQDYQDVMGDAQRRHNEQWLSKLLNNGLDALAATTPKKGRKRATSKSAGSRSKKTCPAKRKP